MNENEFSSLVKQNELKKVGKDIYLSQYQMDVLDKYHIPYGDADSSKELLFMLNEIPEDDYYDELDNVASQIAEISYYKDTRK